MAKLPSTHTNNLNKLYGVAKFARKNADGTYQAAIAMSPSAELTLSVESDPTEYISQEAPGGDVLDRDPGNINRKMSLSCNNLSNAIVGYFLSSSVEDVAQASGSVTGEVSPHVLANSTVFLGGSLNNGTGVFGVSAVSVSSYEGANAATAAVSTAYAIGDVVVPATPNDHWYMATAAGTSAGSAPTWPTDGSTVTDGTVTWQDMGLIAYTVDDDYELDADLGEVHILSTGAIADAIALVPASLRADGYTFRLEIDYTKSAKTIPQVATGTDTRVEGRFYFEEENSKGNDGRWYLPEAQLSPSGELALKSGGDYGKVGFEIAAIKPATGSAIYRNGVPV